MSVGGLVLFAEDPKDVFKFKVCPDSIAVDSSVVIVQSYAAKEEREKFAGAKSDTPTERRRYLSHSQLSITEFRRSTALLLVLTTLLSYSYCFLLKESP